VSMGRPVAWRILSRIRDPRPDPDPKFIDTSTAAPKSLHPTESIESTAAALFVGRHFVP